MPHTKRLAQLQNLLRTELACDAFLLPKTDRHQNEFLQPMDETLAWLTGFTGSAGFMIVCPDEAVLFVDGRYELQAQQEMGTTQCRVIPYRQQDPLSYLRDKLQPGSVIGYNPWHHTYHEQKKWVKFTQETSILFQGKEKDPLDLIWTKRPAASTAPIHIHKQQYSGQSSIEKIAGIQAHLKHNNCGALILTACDSISWLLNIRGTDYPHTPAVDAFAIIPQEGTLKLYINPRKITRDTQAHMAHVDIQPDTLFIHDVAALPQQHMRVSIDPHCTPLKVIAALENTMVWEEDPCALPKAVKNPTEQAGARQAHVQDGVALVEFMSWLSQQPLGSTTELACVTHLEFLRQLQPHYQGTSFDTIAGYGANGAIIHYRPTPSTNATLMPDGLFLLDSGGQYPEGTTDVTRTLPIGNPTPEMCQYYTAVLKGHIALATAQFPRSTTGGQLDTLARHPLWCLGVDYAHGTGHGVGSYLNVHEGPQAIRKNSTVALEPGMILSNEPGYYQPGAFGIRLENLMLCIPVSEAALPTRSGPSSFLTFETLTLAPFAASLTDVNQLNDAEKNWLTHYHNKVMETLSPHLSPNAQKWLEEACHGFISI